MIQRTNSQTEEAQTEPSTENPGDSPNGNRIPEESPSAESPSAESPSAESPSADPASESEANPDLLLAPLEAMLFVAREPLRTERLAETLSVSKTDVKAAIAKLQERYSGDGAGVHLVEIAGGWRMLSNPAFADTLAALYGTKAADRLSPAALETLAIIAYKQPVGRAEIERIRGVGVGPIVRLLLELELVKVAGRDEGLGRALLYGTTKSFLDRFGLASLRDLPASLE